MIVAACTGDGNAQKCLAEYIDHVVESIRLVLAGVDRRVNPFPQMPKPSPQNRLVPTKNRMHPRCLQQISRQMLDEELIIRHIGIQRPNDIVAIRLRRRDIFIELMTSRLRKTDQVEPMPRPTNSKLRIRKERIYRFSVPVRIARTESLLKLLRSRWNSNQVQVNAPH